MENSGHLRIELIFVYYSISGAWRPACELGRSTVLSRAPAVLFAARHAVDHAQKLADYTFQR